MEGRIEVAGRQVRRRKQLPDIWEKTRGYWRLKEKALNRARWRTRCGRGYGTVVRQITNWMNECHATECHLIKRQWFRQEGFRLYRIWKFTTLITEPHTERHPQPIIPDHNLSSSFFKVLLRIYKQRTLELLTNCHRRVAKSLQWLSDGSTLWI